MKLLLINSDCGPDYLSDLINYFFIHKEIVINTNYFPQYLFKDYENINNLYGKGFTLYGKIDTAYQDRINQLSITEIKDRVKEFDLIIFTSINRSFNKASLKSLFFSLKSLLNHNEIYVVDGEDHQKIDMEIALSSNYFKRELIDKFKNIAKPISFSYPNFELKKSSENLENKTQILAPMDPRFLSSYKFENEQEYYQQYEQSIFGTTIKKGGWDCMRHYEILSVKTMLYFPGIEHKPKLTMSNFPVTLQKNINKIFQDLILSDNNIDTLENIRLRYYSKNKIKYGLRRINTKLSKLNITKNNLIKLDKLNNEFNNWFLQYGTTETYNKLFYS